MTNASTRNVSTTRNVKRKGSEMSELRWHKWPDEKPDHNEMFVGEMLWPDKSYPGYELFKYNSDQDGGHYGVHLRRWFPIPRPEQWLNTLPWGIRELALENLYKRYGFLWPVKYIELWDAVYRECFYGERKRVNDRDQMRRGDD